MQSADKFDYMDKLSTKNRTHEIVVLSLLNTNISYLIRLFGACYKCFQFTENGHWVNLL